MSKILNKRQVKISEIVVDRSRNVRLSDDKSYDLRPLIDDLATRGQLTEIALEEIDGVLYPIRGFRRSEALKYLSTNNNPETGKPYIDPLTGKPFENANVRIYTGLTEAERIELMFDHGQTRNLNKLEFYRAIKKSIVANLTELQIVTIGRGLFELYYPLDSGVEDSNKARLDFWKGALQVMKLAATAPKILEEQYEKKLMGQSKWPTNAELRQLVKTFTDELKDDRTNTLSIENPGPKFTEEFERVRKTKEEAPEGTRPKSAAMLNKTQVEALKNRTKSRTFKTFCDFILNIIPSERYGQMDELEVAKDARMSDDEKKILEVIIGVPAPTAETATPAPAAK